MIPFVWRTMHIYVEVIAHSAEGTAPHLTALTVYSRLCYPTCRSGTGMVGDFIELPSSEQWSGVHYEICRFGSHFPADIAREDANEA